MPKYKLFNEEEVLTKAMNLFWKKGYSATSIQDLVNNLGVNRSSIYDTFGGKEELFLKSFENYRITNTQGITEFFKNQPNTKIGFQKLFEIAIKQSVEDADKKGCFVVNTTTELIPGDEKISQILIENRITFEKIFLDYLKQGESEQQFSSGKDLKAIASLLLTLYNGISVVSKVNSNREELNRSIKVALSILE